MAKIKTPNKVRFAWWGAEEDGIVGSAFYVTSLTPEQLAGLEMYLDFDMVGSPNFGLFIYDGDGSGFGLEGPPGSDDIRIHADAMAHVTFLFASGKEVITADRRSRDKARGRRHYAGLVVDRVQIVVFAHEHGLT